VVLGEKPLITDTTTKLDDNLLEELIANISTLASVYHKPPETFVTKLKEVQKEKKPKKEKKYEESLLPQTEYDEKPNNQSSSANNNKGLFELGDLGQNLPPVSQQPKKTNLMDDFDFFSSPSGGAQNGGQKASKELVLPADRGNGMQVSGSFVRSNGQTCIDFTFTNNSGTPLNDFAIQFNKNSFGLAPANLAIQVIMPGQSFEVLLPVTTHPTMFPTPVTSPATNIVQICIKNNTGKYYFQMNVPLHSIFTEAGSMSRDDYLNMWKNISEEFFKDLPPMNSNADAIQKKFQNHNVFYVARRNVQQQDFLYFSVRLLNDVIILMELCIDPSKLSICSRTRQADYVPFFEQSIISILSS